nr:restriction endonuclease subunit S [Bacteroides salyersiae]
MGNVPNLRFPEFTGEWKMVSLQEIASINPKSNSLQDTFIYIDLEAVEKGELKKIQEIMREEAPSRAQRVINNNDILFQCVRPYQKNNYIHKTQKKDNIQWVASTGYAQIRTTETPNYIYHLLNTDGFNRKVMVRCTGSSYPAINSEDLATIRFYFATDTREQIKISRLFDLLDERIATQNKIIEDLKKLKSAIIDQLYSAIKGNEYSYRQIFEIVNERNKQLEYSNILSASQEKGMVNREELNLDIQFERSNINTYKVVRKGDYVIHLRSFQGGYAFSEKTGVCSPAYTILRPNDLLEFRYLSYYFTSQKFIKSLIIVTYGIRDGRSINVEEWLDMKTIIPPKEQQCHIVETIRNIENKIENEELYASCLSKQKQYLLRQLFI